MGLYCLGEGKEDFGWEEVPSFLKPFFLAEKEKVAMY